MKLKIKKGDTVQVIAGKGRGAKGEVLEIDKTRLRVKVSGHKMMTNFDKENGIVLKEGFIHYSNVKLATAPKAKAKTKTKKAAPKAKAAE